MHKEQTKEEEKEEKKEETIPDWVKVGYYAFKRIRERLSNYKNNGWYSKVGQKSITKIFRKLVSGKFNNAQEAKKFYLDNVY